MKTQTIGSLFTKEEIHKAWVIYLENETPARKMCDQVIKPIMARINEVTKQENDPLYLAYMLEHVFNEHSRPPGR